MAHSKIFSQLGKEKEEKNRRHPSRQESSRPLQFYLLQGPEVDFLKTGLLMTCIIDFIVLCFNWGFFYDGLIFQSLIIYFT